MSNYKVLEFNESTGQLIIEYAVGMSPIAVDVPIKNGLYITGEELDSYVQGFIPFEYLERHTQLNAGVPNAAELKSLVDTQTNVELPSVLTEEQLATRKDLEMWAAVKFEQDVAKALVKFGVLTTDPTEIPVAAQ